MSRALESIWAKLFLALSLLPVIFLVVLATPSGVAQLTASSSLPEFIFSIAAAEIGRLCLVHFGKSSSSILYLEKGILTMLSPSEASAS